MMSSEAVLKMAAELTSWEASELVNKMRSGNIKADSLRILHNYVKIRLGVIVSARKIDREALNQLADLDAEVEAVLAQACLF